jgi:GT2 family glycosyltransferase
LALRYPNYEVIIVGNRNVQFEDTSVKVVYTERIGQADKMDIGVAESSGSICAFIDDDAFPSRDWLNNAVPYFKEKEVAAVGGPGITPTNDSLMQKAGGTVYSSILGGGMLRHRYTTQKSRYVDDHPAYNLLVRKSTLIEVGGFTTRFRSGEDTKLCLKIVESGKKILYASDVIVYHHRRPLFTPHLKQVKTYGLHRGFFAKRHPRTSRKASYFFPPILLLFLIALSGIALMNHLFGFVGIAVLLGCFGSSFCSGLHTSKSLKIAFLTCLGIPLTHIFYSLGVFQGLLTSRLGEHPSY